MTPYRNLIIGFALLLTGAVGLTTTGGSCYSMGNMMGGGMNQGDMKGMMKDGNMMSNMMQMMHKQGMMSEECMQSCMKMMGDKGMSMDKMEMMNKTEGTTENDHTEHH